MPAQKSAKPPKSAPATAAKAVSTPAAKAPAKAAAKKSAPAPARAVKKVQPVPVKSSAELTKAADELLKKKPARAKAVAASDEDDTPKKRPGRPAKAAGDADAKAPAKRGRKPKAAAGAEESGDDTDLSDIEADLEGEVEDTPEAAATVEKVKPLRMKISKAKERALMKEFGLDETVLSEEDMAKRRARLKALIKLGKTRGYLTHVEINDHLPDKLVDAETLEAVITTLNDLGVAVYEQTPDAEALIITDNAPAGATEEEAEEAAEAALSTVDSEFGRTTDPVRMYMREMGTVELLTREGEIEIAKRIEGGLMAMMEAIRNSRPRAGPGRRGRGHGQRHAG
ncbi:RNA polymerase sigma factor region1.1 domain-containing protein, partial [Acidovorax sp. NPDC077664]|uniref:RNA polymerase sigma factor region1.1 domain-containing protein n=1 Tax=Acidovorax sp. NPDC077664 TaxID=3390544 RepID=UPI003D08062B